MHSVERSVVVTLANISKCAHGVFLAPAHGKYADERVTGKAKYCGLCNKDQHYGVIVTPETAPRNLAFEMPTKNLADTRAERERNGLTANRHEKSNRLAGQCEKCGEFYHYEEIRDGQRIWLCAECGHSWNAPTRLPSPQSDLLEVAA